MKLINWITCKGNKNPYETIFFFGFAIGILVTVLVQTILTIKP